MNTSDKKREITIVTSDNNNGKVAYDSQILENIKTRIVEIAKAVFCQEAEISNIAIKAFSEFSEAILHDDYHRIYDSISDAIDTFTHVLLNTSSSLSKEELKALKSHYIAWGKLGWTIPANATIDFFIDAPDANSKKAHEYVMSRYRSKSRINELYTCVREYYPNNVDVESAIFCFENRQHKACSLLLFSMIDAAVIKTQVKSEDLEVGKSAIDKLRKQSYRNVKNEAVFILLQYLNLFSCLGEMFRNPENFTLEFRVINRNSLVHGMSKRKVLRRDCVQLFLALINLSYFLDHKNKQALPT